MEDREIFVRWGDSLNADSREILSAEQVNDRLHAAHRHTTLAPSQSLSRTLRALQTIIRWQSLKVRAETTSI
jgi:hypothetical protein